MTSDYMARRVRVGFVWRVGYYGLDRLRSLVPNYRNYIYGLFGRQDDRRDSAVRFIPRILSGEEWQHIESGTVQRITALNLLLDDIYHRQLVLAMASSHRT